MGKRSFILSAVALVMAATQTQAQTATVSLEATVATKCAFVTSDGQKTVSRDVNFGDITDNVGWVLQGLGGRNPLRVSCTGVVEGYITMLSRNGGRLTLNGAKAVGDADNPREVRYRASASIGATGTTKYGGAELRELSSDTPARIPFTAKNGATEAPLQLIFQAMGGKRRDGSYRYLAGTYTDVVTVGFTAGL